MNAIPLHTNDQSDRDRVLTKAILNLAAAYGLTGKELGEIIGLSASSVTRLHKAPENKLKLISENSKEGELSLLLIRLYRSLNAMVGNDSVKAKAWLEAENDYFSNKPIEHIKRVDGLVEVVNYLDAMRGKL